MSNFIEASAKSWLSALTFIGPAISGRPPAPVLGSVHIHTLSGELSGTDYEVSATAPLSDWISDGKPFLAPHRALLDAIKATTKADRSAPVRVTASPSTGNGSSITVEAAGYSLALPADPIAEWPTPANLKPSHPLNIDGRDLKAAIQRVSVAASKNEMFPILNTLRFEYQGGALTMMATDRYRLARSTIPTLQRRRSTTAFTVKAKFAADVARRTKVDARVVLEVLNDGEAVRAYLPGGTLQILTTAGEFPKIHSLFPDKLNTSFVADRAPLLAAAKVALSMSERNTPTLLDFTNQGVTLTFNKGLFDGSTSPLVKGSHIGPTYEPATTALNPQYLVEALAALAGDVVRFGFTKPGKPVLLTEAQPETSHKHLIMPVRLPTRADA